MVAKYMLVFMLNTDDGSTGYKVVSEDFKSMKECITMMDKTTWTIPDDMRKRFACIAITDFRRAI